MVWTFLCSKIPLLPLPIPESSPYVYEWSYFFLKLLFGDIKLSDLECRNRKLSAHDCNDIIKRPFSFNNYDETPNINTSPRCCSIQVTIVDIRVEYNYSTYTTYLVIVDTTAALALYIAGQ